MNCQNFIPWKMVIFCLGLSLLAIGVAFLQGCKHPEMPAIDVEFWAGDADRSSIRRAQENREMLASDPGFNEMACLSYADLRKIYATLLHCKDWGQFTTMSRSEYKAFKASNESVIKKASGK